MCIFRRLGDWSLEIYLFWKHGKTPKHLKLLSCLYLFAAHRTDMTATAPQLLFSAPGRWLEMAALRPGGCSPCKISSLLQRGKEDWVVLPQSIAALSSFYWINAPKVFLLQTALLV